MSLSDLSSLGGFVSGLAVLASLVFLFFQMRQMIEQVQQSERNQRALMNQGIVSRNAEGLRWQAEPHIADLLSRVQTGDTEFTSRELYQLNARLRSSMVSAQDVYVQHKAGLADQIVLDNTLGVLRTVLRQPVYRAIWKMRRSTYAPEWRIYVDQIIEETPMGGASDPVRDFKEALAEVVR